MKIRHFLSLADLAATEADAIIKRAMVLKKQVAAGRVRPTLPGKVLAMIFEKSSTRTRVSFETAMAQLGGHAIFLSPHDTQLGRGEALE
ncbi:MAG: ornithine carbamoyltransferase, partial [Gammaproteobacteria bacterium]